VLGMSSPADDVFDTFVSLVRRHGLEDAAQRLVRMGVPAEQVATTSAGVSVQEGRSEICPTPDTMYRPKHPTNGPDGIPDLAIQVERPREGRRLRGPSIEPKFNEVAALLVGERRIGELNPGGVKPSDTLH
jgi:hypothetical protein